MIFALFHSGQTSLWGTAIEHGVIAVVVQLLLWRPFGIWSGGAIAFAVFLGREIAQHEYKGGGPKEVSWHYGLTHHWNLDSVLDISVPLVACLITAAVVSACIRMRGRGGRK
ncbi:MAG: hypothetical protein P1U68_05960 [Verrucomicrobiales bacterium]|nr:hypothetical protein [Verrucomicrobiales bacterium]